jgi:transposase
VDTSGEAAVDSLGRRTGPRRHYTLEQKREIIEATRVPGASVASVSRAHGINHNVVFRWRRLYDQGSLAEDKRAVRPRLLPVRIETPTVIAAPAERQGPERPSALCGSQLPG